MYVDMSVDLKDKTYLSQQMKPLQKELQSMIIQALENILFSIHSKQYVIKHSEMIILQVIGFLIGINSFLLEIW